MYSLTFLVVRERDAAIQHALSDHVIPELANLIAQFATSRLHHHISMLEEVAAVINDPDGDI